jgi:plastocyanin
MRPPRLPIGTAVTLVVLAACGGGGGDGGTTTPPSPGPPASVAVTLPAASLAIGDSAAATAVVRDAAGRTVSASVTWASSASNIVSVNATTGMLRGLALGSAQITASVASGSAPSGSAALTVKAPATATVSMFPQAFSPVSLVLAVGGVVTYDFPPGIDHNVIFDRPPQNAPADIQQTRNAKITRQFTSAGTYPYKCRIHPGMDGEVIVVP